MVTLITALRGDPLLSARWAESVAASGVEMKILAAVNNAADEELVKGLGGTAIVVKPYTGDPSDEVARVDYIAAVYGALVLKVEAPRLINLDDDVLPPFSGYARLLETGAALIGPGVAGVVTVQPYKDNKDSAILFWKPFDWVGAPMSSIPAMGTARVWGGGTGFSLWRKDVLVKTIPWSTRDYGGGNVPGWDRDLAIKLGEMKAKTYLDCSILCRHDNLP